MTHCLSVFDIKPDQTVSAHRLLDTSSSDIDTTPTAPSLFIMQGGGFTCKMVSKLKVSPFHSVNSPLEAPVTRRRPSGVHCTETHSAIRAAFDTQRTHRHQKVKPCLTLITKTGHLTLLVEVRTNLVVTAFMGLFNIPRGGTSCNRDTTTTCVLACPSGIQFTITPQNVKQTEQRRILSGWICLM